MTTGRINQVAFLGTIGTTHGRYEDQTVQEHQGEPQRLSVRATSARLRLMKRVYKTPAHLIFSIRGSGNRAWAKDKPMAYKGTRKAPTS